MKVLVLISSAALVWGTVIHAQTPVVGRVISSFGTCVIERAKIAQPLLAMRGAEIFSTDNVHCQENGRATIALPGSGREITVSEMQNYLVPAAPRHAVPPASNEKGGIGGRFSNMNEIRRLEGPIEQERAPHQLVASDQSTLRKVEFCAEPLGTVSLIENQETGWYTVLTREYRLPPAANLLRVLIQQSNCFVVVERSAEGMNAMNRERALQQSGEMRQSSNFGKGQIVSSDYGLSPEIIFSQNDTGGMGGAIGGLIGGRTGSVLGAVGASTKTREANAMLTMIDNRSGVQVGASEGSASKTDSGGFGTLFGGSAGVGIGGYTNTPQGKVIAEAFVDAYNQMVVALRNYKAQAVQGQGLGGGGRLSVDGAAAPSQTSAPGARPGAPAMMSMRDAQTKLNLLGYNAGAADGAAAPRTAAALRAFQKDEGLPQSGRLDAATSAALARR